jgi:hypothetical protein
VSEAGAYCSAYKGFEKSVADPVDGGARESRTDQVGEVA